MTAEQRIRLWLGAYKKKTVTLEQLQAALPNESYEPFRTALLALLQEGCLETVKSGGTDYSGLPRRLRIVRGRLFRSVELIQADAVRCRLLPQLDLQAYYEQPVSVWQADLPQIVRLSQWLKHGDTTAVPLQQRSWDIFHDEKFLLGEGARLLQRLGLSKEDLAVEEQPEPLLLAVSPQGIQRQCCCHLTVENKAPYYKLLPMLAQSGFASLILGYGWKIAANLSLLPVQTGCPEAQHIVWYFGDFDWEGLRIWQAAARTENVEVRLAVPFYRAFLACPCPQGKKNQQEDPAALAAFQKEMGEPEYARFENVLARHCYWPQEALTAEMLSAAWKELAHEAGTLC